MGNNKSKICDDVNIVASCIKSKNENKLLEFLGTKGDINEYITKYDFIHRLLLKNPKWLYTFLYRLINELKFNPKSYNGFYVHRMDCHIDILGLLIRHNIYDISLYELFINNGCSINKIVSCECDIGQSIEFSCDDRCKCNDRYSEIYIGLSLLDIVYFVQQREQNKYLIPAFTDLHYFLKSKGALTTKEMIKKINDTLDS